MRTTKLAMMPTDILWEYREFKRDEVPAPAIPVIETHTVDEITEYVEYNGMEPLELSIINGRALLTDGNHRIVAARRLGIQQVAVNVTVFFNNGTDTFYQHTLDRFKVISKDLEMSLKDLFL
jgi:hypothetical protein